MINQSTVEQSLLKWMQEFVEVPHPNLGGWSPCPYARQARLAGTILIKQGTDPYYDSMSLLTYNWGKEVVIFWYEQIDTKVFVSQVESANKLLLDKNIVVLEDHPDVEEIVSQTKMNFGFCPVVIGQQLHKLNSAADQLRSKGYYDTWSESDLDKIVTWRYK